MDQDKRIQKLEMEMQKVNSFLPNVELWINVLAAQFQTNRNFILALDKKPEPAAEPKKEDTPSETTNLPA